MFIEIHDPTPRIINIDSIAIVGRYYPEQDNSYARIILKDGTTIVAIETVEKIAIDIKEQELKRCQER